MPGSGGLAGPGCAFIVNFWKDISMSKYFRIKHTLNKVATHSYYGMHESPYILMVKKYSKCSIYYIASVVFSWINKQYNSEPSCFNKQNSYTVLNLFQFISVFDLIPLIKSAISEANWKARHQVSVPIFNAYIMYIFAKKMKG